MRPGDAILMEEYTYPHMLECVVLPKGGVPVPVPLDGQGIVPRQLRQVQQGGRKDVCLAGAGRDRMGWQAGLLLGGGQGPGRHMGE